MKVLGYRAANAVLFLTCPCQPSFKLITITRCNNPITPQGSCRDGVVCENFACCGSNFECGYSPEFCGAGCRPELGQCFRTITSTTATTTSSSATPSSTDVACGPDAENELCPFIPGTDGFRFCCGADNICGLGEDSCGRLCQTQYGDVRLPLCTLSLMEY